MIQTIKTPSRRTARLRHLGPVTAIILSASMTLTASQAVAKSKAANASSLTALFDCTKVENPSARLACMDREVGQLKHAQDAQQLIVIDQETAQDIKREAFGFSLPSLPKLSFGGSKDGEKRDTLTAKISSVGGSKHTPILHLANGQIWKVTQIRGRMPKGELTTTIKPAALGSYKAVIFSEKRRISGLRVKRIK